MPAPLVLVHSPSVGPATWRRVAAALYARGIDAVVPNLTHIGHGGPPYWPRIATTVADAMGQLDDPGPVMLVGHSNAGLFLPTVGESSPRPVAGAVFVDAALPAGHGRTPVARPEFRRHLRGLVDIDGLLPRWTDWWPGADVEAMLPDPVVRAEIVTDQPRLPLDYYQQSVPVPASWRSVPCAYLQFSQAYADEAERARQAGWPLARVRGAHLHQVVDPGAVTDALLDLVAALEEAGS